MHIQLHIIMKYTYYGDITYKIEYIFLYIAYRNINADN